MLDDYTRGFMGTCYGKIKKVKYEGGKYAKFHADLSIIIERSAYVGDAFFEYITLTGGQRVMVTHWKNEIYAEVRYEVASV